MNVHEGLSPPTVSAVVPGPQEEQTNVIISIPTPFCEGMSELPTAQEERIKLFTQPTHESTPLSIHLSQGLAYTLGSALGSYAPSVDQCRAAFVVPNKVGLTAGARAWSKHAVRSGGGISGFWGRAKGPVAKQNEQAVLLLEKVLHTASWRNLHWLPHHVLVYEVRVPEGYGMRWSQDRGPNHAITTEDDEQGAIPERPWIFRGFVEPMIENGHELRWRH